MPRILIVDDDDAFRKMLRTTLQKLGYDAGEAANGKQAMREQQAAPADVVITDLIMPEQEGLETIQALRRLHPGVRIIAMSGGGRLNARDFLTAARLFGADRTFTKPFAHADLVAAIDELAPKS